MRLRRLLLFGSLSAMAAVLLASCAGSSGSSGQSAASGTPPGPVAQPSSPPASSAARSHTVTVHHTFAPYDGSGQLTAAVADLTRTGTCWTTSIAIPIAGVYRCFADNEILDPCFAPATLTSPPTLACFADPWHPGTLLTLRGALPQDNPAPSDGRPWALQLVNGARCVAITGMVPRVDGIAVGYACGEGNGAALSAGTSDPLIARYGSMHGPLQPERVAAEWRGRSYRIELAD